LNTRLRRHVSNQTNVRAHIFYGQPQKMKNTYPVQPSPLEQHYFKAEGA